MHASLPVSSSLPALPIDPPDLPILAPDDEQAVEAWIKHDGDLFRIAEALEVHIGEAVRRLSSRVVRAYTNAADEVRDAALRRQGLEKLRAKMNNPDNPEEERRAAAAIVRATSHAAYRSSPRSTRPSRRVAGDPRDGDPLPETSPHERTCPCRGCDCTDEERQEACAACDCGYWDDPEVCYVDDGPVVEQDRGTGCPSRAARGEAPDAESSRPATGPAPSSPLGGSVIGGPRPAMTMGAPSATPSSEPRCTDDLPANGETESVPADATEGRRSVAPGAARGCGCSQGCEAPERRTCCDAPCGELREEAG